jgi:RNA-directed DNA polymerase
MPGAALVNTGGPELEYAFIQAERRVLEIQAKLHRWAGDDRHRRFDDLFNLVCDPAFLLVAWGRVRGNKGARSAGVDGRTAFYIEARGVEDFLGGLRESLRARSFRPLPVRERMIPKSGGKQRRLGIATVTDRVVQASLKLVLEPIFEADFLPCSYGFRPNRRAHDAVAEVRYLASRPRCYEWIVEGDIKACFDEISHPALMERVRARIGDKRVLALVKAFLKAGILTEDGALQDTDTGTPQGSILSPLLSNVALSVLDEYIAQAPGGASSSRWQRTVRRSQGLPTFRLVRYADDWCLMVKGTKADAEDLKGEIAGVLAGMGLRLSLEKTLVTHIDEGLDFLGWRIQRHQKKGEDRQYVWSTPTRRRRRCAPSARRSKTCAGEQAPTSRCRSCCTGLIRCCGAGARTFSLVCPARPSAIWPRSPGGRSWPGYAGNTARPAGRLSAAAMAEADGGPPTARPSCSTPDRSQPLDTGTEEQRSPHHGRPQDDEHIGHDNGACGEPVAQ